MSSRRVLKAAEAIRQVVSMSILSDLKDPRIANVTVTFVEVSPDLRHAKVHVSVMGDESKKGLCVRGLQNAAGYLQKKVGNRIDTRYTPRLQFVLDRGAENAMTVTRILNEVLPAEEPVAGPEAGVVEPGSIDLESESASAEALGRNETLPDQNGNETAESVSEVTEPVPEASESVPDTEI